MNGIRLTHHHGCCCFFFPHCPQRVALRLGFFFYATIYFQVNGGQTLLLFNWASNHAQVVADDGGRGKQFLTVLWTCQSSALKRVTDITLFKKWRRKKTKLLTLRTCFDIYFTGAHVGTMLQDSSWYLTILFICVSWNYLFKDNLRGGEILYKINTSSGGAASGPPVSGSAGLNKTDPPFEVASKASYLTHNNVWLLSSTPTSQYCHQCF